MADQRHSQWAVQQLCSVWLIIKVTKIYPLCSTHLFLHAYYRSSSSWFLWVSQPVEKYKRGRLVVWTCPCCWSGGHIWSSPFLTFSIIHSKYSSSLAITSSGLKGLPNFVTQTCISEESEPLIIIPSSGKTHYMCFFTVTVESGNTSGTKWVILVPYVFLLPPLCKSIPISSWWS